MYTPTKGEFLNLYVYLSKPRSALSFLLRNECLCQISLSHSYFALFKNPTHKVPSFLESGVMWVRITENIGY